MDPNDSKTLVGGTNRVWRTQNASTAATWTAISPSFGGRLNALAVATGASDTLYAGSTLGEVHVTTDASNWDVRTAGLPVGQISDILVDPAEPGRAYVTYYNTTGGRLFRTIDFGVTWTDLTGSLPSGAAARALAVDWSTTPNALYVGSGAGVYASADDGATWEKDGADLPNVNIGDLMIDAERHKLYAGTYGRGVWFADLALFVDGFESGDTTAWNGLRTIARAALTDLCVIRLTHWQLHLRSEPKRLECYVARKCRIDCAKGIGLRFRWVNGDKYLEGVERCYPRVFDDKKMT